MGDLSHFTGDNLSLILTSSYLDDDDRLGDDPEDLIRGGVFGFGGKSFSYLA